MRMCSALLKSGVGKEAEAVLWKKKIRCLDKLVDELAKGKPMEKILRA